MLGVTQFRKPYHRIERLAGRYVGGEWVEGGEQISQIFATIQPLAMDKLSPALQGRHIVSAVKIYTQVRLNVAGEDSSNGDFVVFEGVPYLVVERATFHSGVLEHYRYQAVRVNNEFE